MEHKRRVGLTRGRELSESVWHLWVLSFNFRFLYLGCTGRGKSRIFSQPARYRSSSNWLRPTRLRDLISQRGSLWHKGFKKCNAIKMTYMVLYHLSLSNFLFPDFTFLFFKKHVNNSREKNIYNIGGITSFIGPKLIQVLSFKCYQCFKTERSLLAHVWLLKKISTDSIFQYYYNIFG